MEKKAICEKCQHEGAEADFFKTRKVDGRKDGLIENGIRCPFCDYWIHINYSNPELGKLRTAVGNAMADLRRANQRGLPAQQLINRYNKTKGRHQNAYDRLQRTMRARYGGVSPSQLIREGETNE